MSIKNVVCKFTQLIVICCSIHCLFPIYKIVLQSLKVDRETFNTNDHISNNYTDKLHLFFHTELSTKEEPKELTAFVHNVSPIKKSGKTPYFEMNIQTHDKIVRGVHFGTDRHKQLQQISQQKSPVKLSNYRKETKWNVENILLNRNTKIDTTDATAVDFQPIIIPQNQNIATLSSVAIGQLVNIKGQLVQLKALKKFKTETGTKVKADAFLLDPHGCIKITLWEDFACQCQQDNTYTFENVRLQKDAKSQRLFLSTPKSGCSITLTDPFEEQLSLPAELPDTFTSTTVLADVIGVSDFSSYQSCCTCNKKVTGDSPIITCTHCGLKQKRSACDLHFYVKALISTPTAKTTITIFDNTLLKYLSDIEQNPTEINGNIITELLLSLPQVNISYDAKTKIVSHIATSQGQ